MSDRAARRDGLPPGLYRLGERRPVSRDLLDAHATAVAPRLLGLLLVRDEAGDPPTVVRLVETEAYRESDPASHSHPPERRRGGRAAVMFGPPGHAYVYFTYGMHHCVNVTCEPAGTGAAVLLRAGIVLAGHDRVRDRRGPRHRDHDLLAGPARLTRALAIGRDLDGTDLLDPAAPLRLETDGQAPDPAVVVAGPRVGVRHAADAPWRFHLAGVPEVSRYARHPRA